MARGSVAEKVFWQDFPEPDFLQEGLGDSAVDRLVLFIHFAAVFQRR